MKALKICAALLVVPFAPLLVALIAHLMTFALAPFVLFCMAYGVFRFFQYRITHGRWYRAPGPSHPNLNILDKLNRKKAMRFYG